MKKYTLLILISLLFCSISKINIAQSQIYIDQQNQYRAQQNQVLAMNIFSNGLMAGIGGVIHKKKGEKFFPVFLKSFGKGCIGGAIKYTAKYQTNIFRSQQFNILLPINRAYFFLGHSITMNASRNEKMLSNFYANFYGVNFHYNNKAEKGERFNSRLSLGTMVSLGTFLAEGNRLDFIKTLEFGEFYFDKSSTSKIAPQGSRGYAGFNTIAIQKDNGFPITSIIPHELVHNYQFYDYYPISTFYEKSLNKALDKSTLYRKLSKYLDFDYQPLIFGTLYLTQPKPRYFKNYFEFEAEHFGDRRYIPR